MLFITKVYHYTYLGNMDFICWCFEPAEIDFAEGKDLVTPTEYICNVLLGNNE